MENVIDLTNFLEIVGDDIELKKELFEDFIKASEDNIREMAKAIFSEDYTQWKTNAHLLKGASQNLGAVTLGLCASHAESQSDQALWPKILEDVGNLYLGVKTFLLKDIG